MMIMTMMMFIMIMIVMMNRLEDIQGDMRSLKDHNAAVVVIVVVIVVVNDNGDANNDDDDNSGFARTCTMTRRFVRSYFFEYELNWVCDRAIRI